MTNPNYRRLNEIIDKLHRLEELGLNQTTEYQILCNEYTDLQDAIENYNQYCSVRGED